MMKNITLFIVLCLVVLSFYSCFGGITGEGKVSNKDSILAQPIKNVILRGNYQVIFIKGDKPTVQIEANKNLLNNIEININGDDLSIAENKSVSKYDIYKITITSPVFEEISINGNVQGESSGLINQQKMKINLEDNAKLMANLALSELELEMSGNTNANFTGSTSEMSFTISENASIIAPLFNINTADCELSDNASAQVLVLKILEGKGSGNSVLQYVGEPEKDFTTKEQASIKTFKQP